MQAAITELDQYYQNTGDAPWHTQKYPLPYPLKDDCFKDIKFFDTGCRLTYTVSCFLLVLV